MVNTYQESLALLNDKQRLAVETVEGPVMVLAGPGTGKTQVLATRIAHIVQETDALPRSILALTFTEAAAQNMKQRLVKLIGPSALYLNVQTFHSFCSDVMQTHQDVFALPLDSQPISELDAYSLIERLITESSISGLRPMNRPFLYVPSILWGISQLKREGVDTKKMEELVEAEQSWFEQSKDEFTKTELTKQEKRLIKMRELGVIYDGYQRELAKNGWFDFDDMILNVRDAFKTNDDLLAEYQEQLLYFLVDEYQDTNAAQNQVVDLLASYWGEQANVFVVGDPHQAIYRFQGASLENVLSFTERYPTAPVIVLDKGYRCPQFVYDAAAKVISFSPLPESEAARELVVQPPLKSMADAPGAVAVIPCDSGTWEHISIAEKIKVLLEEGAKSEDIAVLYRHNLDAVELARVLEQWQVPFEIDAPVDVLSHPRIVQWINFIRVVAAVQQPTEVVFDYTLYEVLLQPWLGLDKGIVMQVARAAARAKQSIFAFMAQDFTAVEKLESLTGITPFDWQPLQHFSTIVTELAIVETQLPFDEWMVVAWERTGLTNWLKNEPEKIELLEVFLTLKKEVSSWVQTFYPSAEAPRFGILTFLRAIDTYYEHGLNLNVQSLETASQAVRLSTAHKAKGQEWKHVIIFRCIDGKWGNTKQRERLPLPQGVLKHSELASEDATADDRRLFYVALTRAQRSVTITYPKTLTQGSQTRDTVPSIFLAELGEFAVEQKMPVDTEQPAIQTQYLEKLLVKPPQDTVTQREREYVASLTQNFVWSATALNEYLRSVPDFITNRLLRIPQPTQPALEFGTAIHAALELLFKQYVQHHEWLPVSEIQNRAVSLLEKAALTPSQIKERSEYGLQVLASYYQHVTERDWQPFMLERSFGKGWSKTSFEGVQLTGKIDRIDWVDIEAKTVRLIDYKTGKQKTMGDIQGTTKALELSERELALPETIRGPLQRQILFYKLLTELDQSFKATAVAGQFEFVEPDKTTGKIVSRDVTFDPQALQDLKELLKQVDQELKTLSFYDVSNSA